MSLLCPWIVVKIQWLVYEAQEEANPFYLSLPFSGFSTGSHCHTHLHFSWIGLKSWVKASLVFYFIFSIKGGVRGNLVPSYYSPMFQILSKNGPQAGRQKEVEPRKIRENNWKWENRPGITNQRVCKKTRKKESWGRGLSLWKLGVKISEGTPWVSWGVVYQMPWF